MFIGMNSGVRGGVENHLTVVNTSLDAFSVEVKTRAERSNLLKRLSEQRKALSQCHRRLVSERRRSRWTYEEPTEMTVPTFVSLATESELNETRSLAKKPPPVRDLNGLSQLTQGPKFVPCALTGVLRSKAPRKSEQPRSSLHDRPKAEVSAASDQLFSVQLAAFRTHVHRRHLRPSEWRPPRETTDPLPTTPNLKRMRHTLRSEKQHDLQRKLKIFERIKGFERSTERPRTSVFDWSSTAQWTPRSPMRSSTSPPRKSSNAAVR